MKWSNEARIGLAVFGAAVILVAGIIYLRGIDLRSKEYAIQVFYRNVNGLKDGDVVTVAGLSIGRVESMVLTGRQIAVNLSIQTKVQLPRDSRALLKSETIMGGKFIEITPGSDSLLLQNGDTLTGLYEADLSELTATLAPISSNVLGILENVNSTFDAPTRLRIQNIVADLARSSARLQEVVRAGAKSADQAFVDFSAFSRDLARFARTLDTLAAAQRGNLDTGMTSFRSVAINMERVSAKLEVTAESLNEVLAKINRGEGSLGKFVHEEKLYDDLDTLAVSLGELVRDFKENPGRYVRVSVF
jgi:phospholipid/cholesterol/gamma-HCH transport system substrate-binding protein